MGIFTGITALSQKVSKYFIFASVSDFFLSVFLLDSHFYVQFVYKAIHTLRIQIIRVG